MMRISSVRANLGEKLRAFPLAAPATNDIDSLLLACLYALCYALSEISVTTCPVQIRLFTRLPPGSKRITL